MILSPHKDPMGMAISEYHRTGRASTLRVFSSQFDEDEIPVKQLFRAVAADLFLEDRDKAFLVGHIRAILHAI